MGMGLWGGGAQAKAGEVGHSSRTYAAQGNPAQHAQHEQQLNTRVPHPLPERDCSWKAAKPWSAALGCGGRGGSWKDAKLPTGGGGGMT